MYERINQQAICFLERQSAVYSSSVVSEMVEKSLAAKAKLCKILGLKEENDYTLVLPIELGEDEIRAFYPNLTHLILEKGVGSEAFSLKANKVTVKGGETKLTRFLNPTKMEIPEQVLEELQCARVEDFLPRLGELGNKTERELFISANPAELLKATHNCSYSSCYRYGGEWFSSTVAYALDEVTLLTGHWRTNDHYKLGRAWLYALPEEPAILHQKSYGDFNSLLRKSVREEIEKKIDLAAGREYTPSKWKASHNQRAEYRNAGDIYFDNHMTIARSDNVSKEGIVLQFSSAVCLNCGEEFISNTERCLCDSCSVDYQECQECGSRIYDDNDIRWVDGYAYCPNCVSWCEDCNEYVNEDTTRVSGGGYVCSICLEENYTYCEYCNKYIWNNDTVEVNGRWGSEYICDECASHHFEQCEKCGEYFRPEDMTEACDENYCARCLSECLDSCAFFVCDCCGDYVVEVRDHEGESLCENCHPEWERDKDEQYALAQ